MRHPDARHLSIGELPVHQIFVGDDRGPIIEVSVDRYRSEQPVIAMFGGYMSENGDLTRLSCKHATGTDEEHDSAYLADFSVANLRPLYTGYDGTFYSALLVSGSFYLGSSTPEKVANDQNEDEPYFCEREGCAAEPHRADLPFSPPPMHLEPTKVSVSVRFLSPKKRAKRLAELTEFNEEVRAKFAAQREARRVRIADDAVAATNAEKDA